MSETSTKSIKQLITSALELKTELKTAKEEFGNTFTSVRNKLLQVHCDLSNCMNCLKNSGDLHNANRLLEQGKVHMQEARALYAVLSSLDPDEKQLVFETPNR